ncbi:MAG: rhomboid family intramembrane serine protease [Alphaproteobacteria bacterium]|nr:rhomboid family intramembrane serine protease [Alphaproteobacteria bacterium]
MRNAQHDTISLFRSPSPERCAEYALVLMAMGIRCKLVSFDGDFALEVYVRDASRARHQVHLYVQENKDRPQKFNPQLKVQDGITCAWLYAVVILCIYILQRDQLFAIDWLQVGVSHAASIRDGEWWRAVTALGLHVDTAHLVSNLFFGLIFVFLAGELLGWGLALSGIVFGGALGNLINAYAQNPSHTSIGASTSLFAAVGLLAAYSWSRRGRRLNRWIPLGCGVAVLAFIGMGGERTDIFAHVTGFASGCLFGFAFGALDARAVFTERYKRFLGIGAAVFFVFAWAVALQA